jgi:hypothetical protein
MNNLLTKNNLDILFFIVLFYLVLKYSLNLNNLYSKNFLEYFHEKTIKLLLYFMLYLLVNYNKQLGLLYLLILLSLELDVILYYEN